MCLGNSTRSSFGLPMAGQAPLYWPFMCIQEKDTIFVQMEDSKLSKLRNGLEFLLN